MKDMGLSDKKEEQLKRMPHIKSRIFKLKDNLIAHQTVITDIKPIQYYNKVVEGPESEEVIEMPIEQ